MKNAKYEIHLFQTPQTPLVVLAKAERVAVMREQCVDATILLLFSGHLRRKYAVWRDMAS